MENSCPRSSQISSSFQPIFKTQGDITQVFKFEFFQYLHEVNVPTKMIKFRWKTVTVFLVDHQKPHFQPIKKIKGP